MKIVIASLCAVFLASCAQQSKQIYSGLDKNSYGSLTKHVDNDTRSVVSPPSCDPEHKSAGVDELAREITGLIFKPISGLSKVDETVIKEDLQSHFLMAGDPSGHPLVSILDRSDKGIVFWHLGDLVPVKEVALAAQDYCSRTGKTALYEGSARQCSEPKLMPVAINGKRTMIDTYVISSFQCAEGTATKSASQESLTPQYQTGFVRKIQRELIRLKFMAGSADGEFGPKTRSAIVKFQSDNNIPTDGLPTSELLSSLRSH